MTKSERLLLQAGLWCFGAAILTCLGFLIALAGVPGFGFGCLLLICGPFALITFTDLYAEEAR
jgi:hypothetical protein